jgi:hypothetical protein
MLALRIGDSSSTNAVSFSCAHKTTLSVAMRVNNPDHSPFDWRWNVATQHGRRKTMRSGERKSVIGWLLNQFMRVMPEPVTEWLINRSTERIAKAASAIS